jgi:hypothetical protein
VNLGFAFDLEDTQSVVSLKTGCIVGNVLAEAYFGTSSLLQLSAEISASHL